MSWKDNFKLFVVEINQTEHVWRTQLIDIEETQKSFFSSLHRNPESRDHLDMGEVSPLFTWQDSRCDEDFLASLPDPASHLRLATGYGCATIFWLQRNKPGNDFLTIISLILLYNGDLPYFVSLISIFVLNGLINFNHHPSPIRTKSN